MIPRPLEYSWSTIARNYLKSDTIRHFWVDTPATTPERDVVNTTFDVGMIVIFDDVAGHDGYQAHPLHDKFIERDKPNWARVEVFDIGA